jgi:SEC-C motif-containing protein
VLTTPCPCGTGETYDACCGPLLANVAQATSPEQLMRSRYTAFVTGDADHLFRTWHPRTRPDDVRPDPATRWTGLRVLAAEGDTVEFVAQWETSPSEGGELHEVSRFEQRAGRWCYVDGVVDVSG